MDIVYASLERRPTADPATEREAAEAVDALWAHAAPDDGLQHVTGRAEPGRIDLLLYLLSSDPTRPATPGAVRRAAVLLARCHHASPLLRDRYLPPAAPVPEPGSVDADRATGRSQALPGPRPWARPPGA